MLVLLETFEVENMIVFLLEYLGKIKWESLYIGLGCVILTAEPRELYVKWIVNYCYSIPLSHHAT